MKAKDKAKKKERGERKDKGTGEREGKNQSAHPPSGGEIVPDVTRFTARRDLWYTRLYMRFEWLI